MSLITKGVISSSQQLVYLTEWFTEFSDLQKSDFMNNLVDKYSINKLNDQLINGFTQMGVGDRPASIFQCRIKLFTQWFIQWSDEEKHELLLRLRNIDKAFMDQFQNKIETNLNNNVLIVNNDSQDNHNDLQVNTDIIEGSIDDNNQLINANIDDDSKRVIKSNENQEVRELENNDQITEDIVIEDEITVINEDDKENEDIKDNKDELCEEQVDKQLENENNDKIILNGNSEELCD